MRRISVCCLYGLFLSVFACSAAVAQELYGSIKGQIADPSGALVPQASVTATNTATGVIKKTMSDANGTFEFLQLPAGEYNVAIEKRGFKTYTVNRITLALNQIYVLSATLQLGQPTETIVVEADSAQVETSSSQLGTVVQSNDIVDLPLNGRNWTQLQQLAPGVMASSDRFGTAYSTSGGQTQQNSYLIDGADSINLLTNTAAIIPSPDAIQEFNLISSTINAEYSRNGGGILNAVIKSGTNQFHGTAFEFYRDTFLNDRTFGELTVPVFHQNQFGGTVGGPIWKNHTFFFFSYQGTRASEPQGGTSSLVTVLSSAQRGGDFSNGSGTCPFGANVSPIPLIDSTGIVQQAGTPYCTLFPTGVIPAADINPISSKLLSAYVPLPNTTNNEFSFNPTTTTRQDQGIVRVDHNFNSKDTLWGSLFVETFPTSDTLAFPPYGPNLPGFGDENTLHNTNATVDWTHTFSSSTLNEFRLSYNRVNQDFTVPQHVVSPSSAGFNITPQNPAVETLPLVSLTGLFNIGGTEYGPQFIVEQNYQLADNLSKVIGKHTLKFGFSGTRYNSDYVYNEWNSGDYTFGGTGTFSTGVPGADFILGFPDTYYQSNQGQLNSRSYEYYAYGQDAWKVRPDLTLNLGVGYQVDTPLNNLAFGGLANNCFHLGQQSAVFTTAPTGLLFPGDKGCSQSGYYTKYGHVGPRIGFAYSPDANHKLSIRGGFGIYYNRNVGELQNDFLTVPPFTLFLEGVASAPSGGSPSFANPWNGWLLSSTTPATVTAVQYPGGSPYPYVPPTPPGSNYSFPFYLTPAVTDPNLTSASTMNFNLNVQRELPGRMVLQVGYVGALGRHLNLVTNLDPISLAGAQACATSAFCIENHIYQDAYFPENFQLAPEGIPGYVLASLEEEFSGGASHYNSLQVRLDKHLSHGLSFGASYTWSHSIDNGSGFEDSTGISGVDVGLLTNPYNRALDIADSDFDARQRFVVNYSYQIPGVGRFTNNKVLTAVFSGWRFSGITTLQSGFPFTIYDSSSPSLTNCGCDTAFQVGKFVKLDPRTNPGHMYFNTSAFQEEPIGTLPTGASATGQPELRRNPFHGPGINQTDALLAKTIPIHEKLATELRLEAYNLFNHTEFAIPDGNIFTTQQFGEVFGTLNGVGRVVQLGAKLYF